MYVPLFSGSPCCGRIFYCARRRMAFFRPPAARLMQVFRQAFLQKGRYSSSHRNALVRPAQDIAVARCSVVSRSPGAAAPVRLHSFHFRAPDAPPAPATAVLFLPAGRSSPPGRNRTRRTGFPASAHSHGKNRIFCTLSRRARDCIFPPTRRAAYAGFSPGLFAKRPSPRAAASLSGPHRTLP